MNTAVLIPAYEPDEKLIRLINELTKLPFPYIIVVDDGSSEKCSGVFRAIGEIPNVRIIHHMKNMGKGAALKTGMKQILDMDTSVFGCITVDADGQHLPEDILKVADVFERNNRFLVLGCRDFDKESVPAKSKFGNKITRTVYKLMTGTAITDTQTGLRAIPLNAMKKFKDLPGDRYEFEMNMLMQASKSDIPIKQVTIQTVYIDRNKTSHFNPLLDSVRIYKEIIKFSFSSLFCSIIDIGIFTLVYGLFKAYNIPWPLLGATGTARLISSGVNFTLNKKVVFQNNGALFYQAVKYYALCAVQMLCSWLILEGFTWLGLKHVVILKIIGDTLLFLISFTVQRLFVFGRNIRHEQNTSVF